MKKIFKVSGMSCQNCVRHVKEAAERLDGVLSAEVSLEDGCMAVDFSQDRLKASDIIIAVCEAGYPTSLRKD